jgi:hypothetical protein
LEAVMQRVFVAHDSIEANFVKDLLIRGGIAAEVHGEHFFGVQPHIGFADETLYPSVWIVEDTELADAVAIIEDYLRRKNISIADMGT